MEVFKSVWFWLLLIGLLFVIIGTLITGVCINMNGWSWFFLTVGFLLILVGLALSLLKLVKNKAPDVPVVHTSPSSPSPSSPTFTNFKYSHHHYTPHSPYVSHTSIPVAPSPTYVAPSTAYVAPSPTVAPSTAYVAPIISDSPVVSSQVSTNIPQAQRGFNTSAMEISALSP